MLNLPMKKNQQSLRLALFFCLVVFFAVGISLTAKFVSLLKQSSYDSSHRYTVYIEKTPLVGKVISVDPVNKTVSEIQISSKTLLSSPSTLLGIPTDVKITLEGNTDTSEKSGDSEFFSLLTKRYKKDNPFTLIDTIRLGIFLKSVKKDSVEKSEIMIPISMENADSLLENVLTDQSIVKEDKTVAIVNASGISGIGKRAERILLSMGATVISVTTATQDKAGSYVSYAQNPPSYTAEKIGKIFRLSLKEGKETPTADITLVIGKDSKETSAF